MDNDQPSQPPSRRAVLRGIAAGTGASALGLGAPAYAASRAPDRAVEVLLPDAVYVNGTVITMDSAERVAEAFAVKGDAIVATGSSRDMRQLAGPDTAVHDLRGRTVVPGFIDAHSHFPGSGTVALFYANITAPPVGQVRNIDDMVEQLTAKAAETPAGELVQGRGFDQAQLEEKRFPTNEDLDRASTEHPIWARHSNGHMGVANSLALELAGITRDGPDDDRIIRHPNGDPTGLLLSGAQSMVSGMARSLTDEQRAETAKKSVELYVAEGVTTVIIPSAGQAGLRRIQHWRVDGILPLRFTCNNYASLPTTAQSAGILSGFGDEWVRVGAYGEQTYDGSIQGWTGYLKNPYHTVPDWYNSDWRGFSYYTKSTLFSRVRELHQERYQTAIHANGDQAIEDLLDAIEAAQNEFGDWGARHRIEHAQMSTESQLRRMADLGVSPSFFVSHTFYWGDEHRDIFIGPWRARSISPLKSATELGIRYSIHLDSPVVPMEPLNAIWSAVNRITRSGRVLGPEQRVDPMTALRAMTIDAAWQNHEDEIKGSLEPGKLADFVILDADPRSVDPMTIRDIKVQETVIGGETVYQNGQRP